MKWIKASERLPNNLVAYRHLRITVDSVQFSGFGNIKSYYDGPAWHDIAANRRYDFNQVEWLDESAEDGCKQEAKLVTAVEDDSIVVANQMKAEMFNKIANNRAARQCAIVACEWIIDSWQRDGSPHFTATAKCWERVKEALEKMSDY